ncbi:MAG: sigma-70 family RNA polymerase sigma factor [Myxococcota bacterium]
MAAVKKDDELSWYLTQVWNYPKLTREREQALARRWRDKGDRRAADQLISASLRHVVPIALKYRRSGEPLADLIAEGNLGLMHAIQKFDPERDTRFITYAKFWVRAYLTRYVRRVRSMVSSMIQEQAALYAKVQAEKSKLASRYGDADDLNERVAERLEISLEQIYKVENRFSGRDVSIDAAMDEDSTQSIRPDVLAAPGMDPSQHAEATEMKAMLRRAVENTDLEPRERFVIEQRLLCLPGSEPSFAEIGRKLNVTREWARQLERRAMKKLHAHFDAEAA